MSSADLTPRIDRRGSSSPIKTSAASSKNKSPSRPSTSSAMSSNGSSTPKSTKTTSGSGLAPRPSVRRSAPKTQAEEDAKAETAALIDDLKEQLRKTELASEQYQKQLQVVQSRLDEALNAQNDLEQMTNQHSETVARLEVSLLEAQRSKDDLQVKLDEDEHRATQEREASSARETDLNDIITRLKDSLAQRDPSKSLSVEGGVSRSASFRGRSSPNPDSVRGAPPLERRDSSQSGSLLILQTDKIIEDLRLELAEMHLKIMEFDHAGGGRLHDLEKLLLETRMSNAKLLEDNESYQYLLQEKTLSGDMVSRLGALTPLEAQNDSRAPSRVNVSGNLADELETLGEEDESDPDTKRLEKELAAQKDQNKALTLYINRIIGKLLASENFEQLFEATSTSARDSSNQSMQKGLPQPPADESADMKENAGPGLLARAGSIFGGRGKPRPKSYQPPQGPGQSQAGSDVGSRASIDQPYARPFGSLSAAVEDPSLAPRVPLHRGSTPMHSTNPQSHRRTTSEISTSATTSIHVTKPSIGSLSPPRTSSKRGSMQVPTGEYLSSEAPAPSRHLSASEASDRRSISSATPSDSGYSEGLHAPSSPPRSLGASSSDAARTPGTTAAGGPATVSGKQMRPLRLVQEKAEFDAEKKKANRGSWMGWLNKGPQPGAAPVTRSGSQGG